MAAGSLSNTGQQHEASYNKKKKKKMKKQQKKTKGSTVEL